MISRALPLMYAAGTTGATAHPSGELLRTTANIDIVHVPYKGTGAQLTSVIGGETQFTFAGNREMGQARAGLAHEGRLSGCAVNRVTPQLTLLVTGTALMTTTWTIL